MSKQLLFLLGITVLPLGIILCQLTLGLTGIVGYSLYKIAFIVPPLLYCYMYNISVVRDIWRPQYWRNGIGQAASVGTLIIGICWGMYALFGDLFINEQYIVNQMRSQFSVTISTVLFIAPITIFFNSLLEETFYRGFAFGQLQEKNLIIAYLVPSIAFTVQHVLFIWQWLPLGALYLVAICLLFFALLAADLYRHTNTIVAPWVLHVAGDIGMMGIAVWLLW